MSKDGLFSRRLKYKSAERVFFNGSSVLETFTLSQYKVVVGGDFNVIFNPNLDGSGGTKRVKDSVKFLEDTFLEHDLVDIWRVRNPTAKRLTWSQKNPIIKRRLDFWLISNTLQEEIDSVDITSSIKSAITLSFNGVENSSQGPSFWKFNASLVNDQAYCDLLHTNFNVWLKECNEVVDKRVLWALLLKYKIRRHVLKPGTPEPLQNTLLKANPNHQKHLPLTANHQSLTANH